MQSVKEILNDQCRYIGSERMYRTPRLFPLPTAQLYRRQNNELKALKQIWNEQSTAVGREVKD
jgi:hypothetical protein